MKIVKSLIIMLVLATISGCGNGEEVKEHILGDITGGGTAAVQENKTEIIFENNIAEINGKGAEFSDNILLIKEAGEYTITGELEGSVVVEASKSDVVEIVLDGVDISNPDGSAIYVKSADKLALILAADSQNSVSDGETYALEDDAEQKACIYSADDITIKGDGSLAVYAKCRNGIHSKNDLRIKGGNLTVTAPSNALKGKDSVEITAGNITVTGAKDGIKSDNEEEEGRGIVIIKGGNIKITCQDDGIQAFRKVIVESDAKLYIDARDNAVNCDGETDIAEGCLITE